MTKAVAEKDNHAFCLETIAADQKTEESVMILAERYYRIHALKLYEPAWSSFEEFCMEIKHRSYKTVMKLIDIHAKFVIQYKFSPARLAESGGWSVISELLPVIKTREDAETWLERAKTAPREHLRQDVREVSRGIPQGTCTHKNTVTMKICTDCGYKERV